LVVIKFDDTGSMTSSNKCANTSALKLHLKVFIIQKNFDNSRKEFSDN
jgi:hypothetical protein